MAFAYPIETEMDVKTLLEELKLAHPKARHFCYAWILDDLFRANDDGEPSGSAGKPIYNCLVSKELNKILVVVVRYFGGTLLGVPGLINAYKEATLDAIAQSKMVEKIRYSPFKMAFDVQHINEVMRVVRQFDLKIVEQSFSTQYLYTLQVRRSKFEEAISEIKTLYFVEVIVHEE